MEEKKLFNLSVFRLVTTLNVNSIPHEEENAKLVCSSSNLHSNVNAFRHQGGNVKYASG